MLSLCLTFICSHALRLTGIEEPALCKATTQDTHHEVANLERDLDLSSNEEFLKGYSKEFSEAAAIGLSKQSYDLASKLNVKRAFVTTTTLCPTTHGVDPRTYLKHVLVLGHALQAVNSSFPLVALIMDSTDCHLVKEYDGRELKELNMIFVRVPVGTFNQDEMPKPQKENWRYTFPKTYIWAMTGFQKLVFLDGDVIVMKNLDDLLDSSQISGVHMATRQGACPHPKFEQNLHMGGASNLMVLQPNLDDFRNIHRKIVESEKGNDQAIIAEHFKDRLVLRPPADMLYTECLMKFDCRLDDIRAVHLGFAGRGLLTKKGGLPSTLGSTTQQIFEQYLGFCNHNKIEAHVERTIPC